jgi:hypothetical protein
MTRSLQIGDASDIGAAFTLALSHDKQPAIRVQCSADSVLIDACWPHLRDDTLIAVLAELGGRAWAFMMAVMSIEFGIDDTCIIHLQEWDAAGDDDGPDGDDGEPLPLPVKLIRVA